MADKIVTLTGRVNRTVIEHGRVQEVSMRIWGLQSLDLKIELGDRVSMNITVKEPSKS